jgi:hypothetical protein
MFVMVERSSLFSQNVNCIQIFGNIKPWQMYDVKEIFL